MKIVVPDDAPVVLGASEAWKQYRPGRDIRYYDSLPGSEQELTQRIGDAEAVINIRSSCRFTEALFAACPALRMVSIWGTGTDNIDLEAARRRGIRVTNTPGVAAISIAEHCLALTLAVARKLITVDASVRRGEWQKGSSVQLSGKTLGIIGLGAIGSRFAQLGGAIGMRVICWTMHPRPELGFALVPMEELLRDSDVISLHLRLSDETRGFLGREHFGLVKPSAIFINTARGPIVDEAALVDALSSGRLAGAGLDVFDKEPLPPGNPFAGLNNVVLTPHCAGVTPEVLEAGLAMALANVEAFAADRPEHVVV